MSQDHPSEEFENIEELTAYLDGELDEQAHQRVEQRLRTDPDYLANMQALQKTWDLLDFLPQAEPTASFTKTTMELVVQEASRTPRPFSWKLLFRGMTLLLVFAGVLLGSFGWMHSMQSRSNQMLVEHLVTINFHEKFSAISLDLDLLVEMDQRGLFNDTLLDSATENDSETIQTEIDDVLTGVLTSDRQERISWIQSLSARQKSKLKKRLDDFLEFDPKRQQRLTEFGDQLSRHPERDRLLKTLTRYYEWLKSIDGNEKARLQDLSPNELLRAIERIRTETAERQFVVAIDDLDQAASQVLFVWYCGLIDENEQALREHFPEVYRKYRERNKLPALSRPELERQAKRLQINRIAHFLVIVDRSFVESIVLNDDLRLLLSLLPDDVDRRLYELTNAGRRAQVIDWLKEVLIARAIVPRKELEAFEGSLPESVRKTLDPLPQDERLNLLRIKFLERNLPLQVPVWQEMYEGESPFPSEIFE